MLNIVNTKNGKVIIQVSSRKWEKDDMWRNRIINHLSQAGIKVEVMENE